MAEQRGGSGNFSQDREKASEAGKKGGQQSGGNFKRVVSIAMVADANPTTLNSSHY